VRTVLVEALGAGRRTLSATESHHLLRVLRLARGGHVRVVDGAGLEAVGTLVEVEGPLATLDIGEVHAAPPPPTVLVLLGAPKGPLVEEAVTLGTELGATAFWIVRVERTPPGEVRLDRLERVLDAALKQCRRTDRPALRTFPTLAAALAALPEGARFLGAPGGAAPVEARELAAADSAAERQVAGGVAGVLPRPMILGIGPEGGFTSEEVDSMVAAGFVPFGLGRAILRAPTAVAAGLAVLLA